MARQPDASTSAETSEVSPSTDVTEQGETSSAEAMGPTTISEGSTSSGVSSDPHGDCTEGWRRPENGECRPWQDCVPGQYVAAEGTPTSDRVCSACVYRTFSTEPNSAECLPHAQCSPGYWRTLGTATSDTVCEVCPAHTISDIVDAAHCWPCSVGTESPEPGGTRCISTGVCDWDEVEVTGELGVTCEPGPNWRVVGGPDYDVGSKIRATTDGYVQVLTEAHRTVTFDRTGAMVQFAATGPGSGFGLTNSGLAMTADWSSVYFTDRNGATIQTVGVAGREPLALASDEQGAIYRAAVASDRWYLEKVTPAGVRAWERSMPSQWDHDRTVIAQRGDYLAVCIDHNGPQIRLLKASGQELWTKNLAVTTAFDPCVDIEVDAQGNVWLAEHTSSGWGLTMWDVSGAERWTKSLPSSVIPVAIAADAASNLVLASGTYSSVVQKFDGQGTARWTWPSIGTLQVAARDVSADANGDFWVTGTMNDDLVVVHFAADVPETAACDYGSYAPSPEVGATCEPWTDCGVDEYQANTPGVFADRQCTACPLGRTNPDVPGSYCGFDGCCVNTAVCPPGTRVVEAGSEEVDAVCEPCPAGTYTAQEDAPECLPCAEGSVSDGYSSSCYPINSCPWDELGGEAGDGGTTCSPGATKREYEAWMNSVVSDGRGGVFVTETNHGDGAVRHVDASGNTAWLWRTDVVVTAVTYDASTETLYAGGCLGVCLVTRLDVEGHVISQWPIDVASPSSISDLLLDADQHVYVAGAATTDTKYGGTYAFIHKLDETGLLLWSTSEVSIIQMEGYHYYDFARLERDGLGNIYGLMIGEDHWWRSPYRFELHKWAPDGTQVWELVVDPVTPVLPIVLWAAEPMDAVVTENGETYVAIGSEGLIKVDTEGNLVWQARHEPEHSEPVDVWGVAHTARTRITAVQVDENGRVWAGGTTNGIVDGNTSRGPVKTVLLEFDGADGSVLQAYRIADYEHDLRMTSDAEAVFIVGAQGSAYEGNSFISRTPF